MSGHKPGMSTFASESDPSALEMTDVFGRCHVPIERYCRRRLGSDDAPDAAAEVFAVAWRKRADMPPGDSALPWLYAIARNVIANHTRSRHRFRRLLRRAAQSGVSQVEDPGLQVVMDEEHRLALEAVSRLGEADREVLALSAWEELSNAELGIALGCSTDAAAQRLHRAKQRLGREFRALAAQPPRTQSRRSP